MPELRAGSGLQTANVPDRARHGVPRSSDSIGGRRIRPSWRLHRHRLGSWRRRRTYRSLGRRRRGRPSRTAMASVKFARYARSSPFCLASLAAFSAVAPFLTASIASKYCTANSSRAVQYSNVGLPFRTGWSRHPADCVERTLIDRSVFGQRLRHRFGSPLPCHHAGMRKRQPHAMVFQTARDGLDFAKRVEHRFYGCLATHARGPGRNRQPLGVVAGSQAAFARYAVLAS